MKAEELKYRDIITIENLFHAWDEFKKEKRNKKDVQKFERHLEDNLFSLYEELNKKTYKHGTYQEFYVTDPKRRHIHKSNVRDRVLHHLLYKYLYELFDKHFIYDSYSCRKSKGTHKAVKRLKKMTRAVSLNYTGECWSLKCDIKKFFASVDHSILKELISRKVKDEEINWLINNVIDSFSSERGSGRGIPLGNLTSQIFSNVYLNELDQFVKRNLECEYYVRYVDDFIVLNKNRSAFINFENKINNFLQKELDLELNFKKTKFCPISKGIEFLGYFIKPGYVLVKQSVVKRFKNKLNNVIPSLTGNPHSLVGVDFRPYRTFGFRGNDKSIQSVLATINSYYGHFRYAFSFNLRKAIFQKHLSMGLKGKFLAPPNYNKIIFK